MCIRDRSGTTAIRLDPSDSSGNDDIEIAGGTNVTVTRNSANKLTISSTDTNTDTNTTYLLKGQQTSGNNTNPNLLLDASSGTDDTVQLVGSGSVSVTRNNDGQITISGTDTNTDTNTTYLLKAQQVSGSNNNPNLLLDASSGTDDTVRLIGGTNVTITRNNDGQITFSSTDTNTDTNTTYDLLVPSGTTAIRLDPSDSSGNDDITITGGTNISVTRTSGSELTISSSANIDVTQLDLNRIRFGPGNAVNDDANIEWLGGSNAGYLRISTYDDAGSEYIELGDYDYVDASTASGNTFTQWMKLNRTELYMARDVRLNAGLEDKDGQKGSSGQVLVSTGSQVNWVNASTVGGSVDTKYDLLVPSGTTKIRLEGATDSGNTNDDVEIAGGTGISVTRTSSTKLTITNTDTGSSSNANVTISTGAPSSPSAGDLWWDSDDGDLLVYYNDGNTSQWVTTGSSGQKGDQGPPGTDGTDGTDGVDGVSVKGQKGEPTVGVSNYQEFTSSGTWSKPSTGNMCNVYLWGGGGGGGGNSNHNGGGGGGGYAEYQIPMTSLAATVSVTVGSGGGVNQNGGTSQFGSSAYQAGGGNAGHNGTNYETSGYGGNGGSPLGTGEGASRGFYDSYSTDDGTQVYYNTGASSGKDGHSGGGGGSAAGGGPSGGGSAYMAGGGGGARRHNTTSSGGSSVGGGNGGNGNSSGSIPAGGGGARASGARGLVRVVVV